MNRYMVVCWTLVFFWACCKTTVGQEKSSVQTQAPSSGKSRDGQWYEYVTTQLKTHDGYLRALALVSYSGFSNTGQVFVFYKPSGEALVQYVKPNKTKVVWEKKLSQKEAELIRKQAMEARSLKDFDKPSFDGVTYTYWEIEKQNDKITTVKKIVMINPDIHAEKPQKHLALIKAFQDLIPSQAKN